MSIPYWIIAGLMLIFLALFSYRVCLMTGGREQKYETGCCKTIGSREIQEDEFALEENENGLLAVLSDGMGKGMGGKLASKTAVKVFRELFLDYNALDHPSYFFQKAFQSANREILNQMDEGRGGAALSAVIIQDHILYYGIVGNVKIAVYRNGELIPVGTGHTIDVLAENKYYQGMLAREDALLMLEKKRTYNYLGRDGFGEIEFYDEPVHLRYGDVVALMSDGIYEGMEWKRIEEYLSNKKSCQDTAFDLIEYINRQEGEKDNAGVVLIRVGEHV